MYQKIDEPIDVVAVFEGSRVRPVRFRWQGRTYRLKEITASWQTRVGTDIKHHFSAIDQGSANVQLTYDLAQRSWVLTKIWSD